MSHVVDLGIGCDFDSVAFTQQVELAAYITARSRQQQGICSRSLGNLNCRAGLPGGLRCTRSALRSVDSARALRSRLRLPGWKNQVELVHPQLFQQLLEARQTYYQLDLGVTDDRAQGSSPGKLRDKVATEPIRRRCRCCISPLSVRASSSLPRAGKCLCIFEHDMAHLRQPQGATVTRTARARVDPAIDGFATIALTGKRCNCCAAASQVALLGHYPEAVQMVIVELAHRKVL